jgi:hypothetical protein
VVPENDDVNSVTTEVDSINENAIGGLDTGKGTLKIYLTDAPGDYNEVNINISRIEGHIAVEDEEGYWEILKEWSDGLPVDLTKLEDVSILLASLELAPNKYTQLRIFLGSDASLLVEGEELQSLEIPSSANTGIKLNHPFDIEEGKITKLTIDFDAEKSVIKTGNGKYKMKPVIHVTSETYSAGEVPEGVSKVFGTVSYYESDEGVLALVGLGGANIELTGGTYVFVNTTVTLEEPGSEGKFSLDNVPAGTYILNVYADGYDNYSESVVVVDEEDTEANVVLLSGGISGSVVDSGDLSVIEGAMVSVELEGGIYTFNSSAVTNASGEFVIEQIPVGIYDLTVSATNYDTSDIIQVTVTTGDIIEIGEIGLSPTI